MMTPTATDSWSPLHDLALLFLSLTHGTDADLDAQEKDAALRCLKRWFPRAKADQIRRASDEVLFVYLGEGRDSMIQNAAESLRQVLTPEQRIGVLNDLADLAVADGSVQPTEVAFIQRLATYWDIEPQA